MPTYRAKLKENAFEEAQAHDTGTSIFESQERYDQRVDEDGYVTLRKREFDRLTQLGLIADAETDPIAETRNPDLDDDSTRARTMIPRLPQRATAVSPGGVGHQPNDNYSNQRVNEEARREEERGAALQRERGLPNAREQQPEEALRSDHSLPEQVKEFERQTKERDDNLEKARREAEKDRDKARRDHERQEREDQKAAQAEREKRANDLQTGEVGVRDQEVSRRQGAGLAEDQNREGQDAGDQPRGDGESDAKGKAKGGTAKKER